MKNQVRQHLTALALLASAWPLAAQTNTPTPTKPEEEVVVLSPFEVNATKDTGYQATETLAGTRIRTDLKDVGAAISVITKEFLQDIGATDNTTLLQYTTNAEVAGTRGTYAGLGNAASVDETGNLRAPGGAQNRVRGLAAADNARDYFITDIPWDSFNVDRVDILRGPNSILFGLGSPAGIVNASLRNAEFRNKGSLEARTGSYGSVRTSLDLNQELIKNVLAIRVDGLWNNEKYRQNPAFQDSKRFYGALRFDPQLFKDRSFHTSIKAKFENGDVKANRPRIVPPNDAFTAWWRPVAVSADNPFGGMGKTSINNPYDPFRTDNVTTSNGYGTSNSTTINYQPYLRDVANQQQPVWLIDGTSNQLYQVYGAYINNGALNSSGAFTGISSGLVGKRQNGILYLVNTLPSAVVNYNQASSANFPAAKYGQYRTMSLLDPTVFDFYNTLIDGPTKHEWENWNSYNVDFSQTAFNDRVGLDVSIDHQKYRRGGDSLLGYGPTITLDITKNLADYYVSGANGTTSVTNPNYGRPAITAGAGNGSSYLSDRKYMRASLFGEVRASDFTQSEFLVKLLGKHRFNGVAANEKFANETREWQMVANSQAWAGYWNGNNGNSSDIGDRAPTAVIYLGSSVVNRASPSGANIPGITAPVAYSDAGVYVFDTTWKNYGASPATAWNVPASLNQVYNGMPVTGSTTQLTEASNPANYVGWNSNFQDNLLRYNNGQDNSLLTKAQKALRETNSYSSSYQGFFWNDAVVATLGWRYDEVKTKDVTALNQPLNRKILNIQPDVYRLPDAFPLNQIVKGHSTSGGAVVHLNKILGDRDPLPFNISLSYNESSNFQVTSVRRDIYGTPIGNPSGKTYEYGALLSTKDGKYSLRVVNFTTRTKDGNSTLGNAYQMGGTIGAGLAWRNVFLYQLGGYDWASRNQDSYRNRWTNAYPALTATQAQAELDAAITGWNDIQKYLEAKGFFKAWNFTPTTTSALVDRTTYLADPAAHTPDPATLANYNGNNAPQGFAVTADTESKGYEFELTANPLPNWRIAFNAGQTTATQTNVGGATLNEFIGYINSKLINSDGTLTPAGKLPRFGGAGNAIYPSIWGPFLSNYTLMKLTEGSQVPEIRKWRYNVVTNYTFRHGFLKDVGVGASYRWQDKVILGYPVVTGGAFATYDISKPYNGPSEDAVDLWASYGRKLTEKVNWKIQLNVRNAFAKDGLIPISIEPDGKTWASVRVKPTQEWFVTNTFSF